jgi:hypothetical protein
MRSYQYDSRLTLTFHIVCLMSLRNVSPIHTFLTEEMNNDVTFHWTSNTSYRYALLSQSNRSNNQTENWKLNTLVHSLNFYICNCNCIYLFVRNSLNSYRIQTMVHVNKYTSTSICRYIQKKCMLQTVVILTVNLRKYTYHSLWTFKIMLLIKASRFYSNHIPYISYIYEICETKQPTV